MRKSLKLFTEQMEAVLKANDHKGGWLDLTSKQMFNHLLDEILELHSSMRMGGPEEIKKECCDVANFAMFIFDAQRFKKVKGV